MRKNLANYLIYTLLLLIAIVVVRLYSGPLKLVFAFEMLSWLALTICFTLITGRFVGSSLIGLLIIVGISEISILKQDYIGQKLYFSDFLNVLTEPAIIISFASKEIILVVVLMVAVAVISKKIEEKSYERIVIKLAALGLIVLAGWSIVKEHDFVWRWNIEKNDGNFTMLIGELIHPKKLEIEALEQNSICCAKSNYEDIKLKKLTDSDNPHIVAILLESQTDLNNLKGFQNWGSDWSIFNPMPIKVYAIGGGTWIQEYAFLHGVNPKLYGDSYDKINLLGPGKLDGRIAPSLKEVGYQTNSYLSYRKKFYSTDIFHKSLGVDRIVDCRDRGDCKRNGTYFGIDENMFHTILEDLKKAEAPQFTFAVTMTNHGPFSGSGLKDLKECPSSISLQLCGELNDFRVRSDKLKDLIVKFTDSINEVKRRTIVLFFGDHISPTLASNFKFDDFIDGKNNESILMMYDSKLKEFIDIKRKFSICGDGIPSEYKDALVLRQSGFDSIYVNEKLKNLQKCE